MTNLGNERTKDERKWVSKDHRRIIAQMTQKIAEEFAHFIMANIAVEKAEIQIEALTARADRDAR
jgi:hypothetical protein